MMLVISIITAIFVFWSVQSSNVLEIKNGPVPVRPAVQRPDELIFLNVDFCKTQDVSGVVRRFLISDTVRIPLPLQADNGPKSCQHIDAPLLIPKQTAPDKYHVHFSITYKINPIHEVIEEFDSQTFAVQ